MSILGWIIFGLITGFIASKIVNDRGEGCFLNIALGVVGAVVGGAIFSFLGQPVFFHFSLWSMFVAVLGAVIVLYIYHAVTGSKTLR
ncbi:MAG: GlsB/YeaQ/YmgE family stress response membrane protein [Alphaproteobacteria bacterium]|nr:GlsB/YeaQ/YmgE family stress response membrane protein [Alphaproteobacteria bacterium]MDE1987570.1 GlsB/YeaQ/YmgE family stress response membrane protein [Alphaproteobacteria bacterium]MDE2162154.1 GlsB/YeaQ/YmgE family stress response membrane protein [Alphaproteobacteria bacterium]MDE2266922.1 GlsB/YeaQ/YmgE family stress response membrane protein [Alphaproteobacteria bacterium]MDE2500747.1 GlsB/YeaQ/YmgE family stress response membrane protein [Alphaproteobacteria bacterium]